MGEGRLQGQRGRQAGREAELPSGSRAVKGTRMKPEDSRTNRGMGPTGKRGCQAGLEEQWRAAGERYRGARDKVFGRTQTAANSHANCARKKS